MCGFVGIISKKNKRFNGNVLEEMINIISHRGPDDSGTFFHDDWLALGFRRLSILDLSMDGHQPMCSADNRFVIVYNGEIYNYREIRDSLEKLGYSFKSGTDTEVILSAYREYGKDCMNKFTGMFAFVIADLNEKKVFVARDQLGIKPLFFYEDSDFYIFTSEIKSLLPYTDLSPNQDSFHEYLVFRSIISENTMFKEVRNVLPGHYMEYNNAFWNKSKYFDLTDTLKPDYSKSFEEVCDQVEKALSRSIEIHLRSDVEVGVLLSGGVDSSLITSLAANKIDKKFHTFSISFPDVPECDESKYQKQISERYGTQHHNYEMDEKNFVRNIDESIWHYEHPLNDPNAVCTYHLVEKASKYITVMLCGEGADESFLGYTKFLEEIVGIISKRTFLYNHPFLRKLMYAITGKPLFNITKYDPAMYALSYSDLNDIDLLLNGHDEQIAARKAVSIEAGDNIINKIILQDQKCDLTQWLYRADRIGMAKSMELRVPFCTHEMFSLANTIPYSYHVHDNERKCVLKKISEKYMDHEQIYRTKIGFGVPLPQWLSRKKDYYDEFCSVMQSQDFAKRIYTQDGFINKLFDAFLKGEYKEKQCGFLWTYFNLEKWYRIFFEGGWKDYHGALKK